MTTIADYVNRTADAAAFQGWSGGGGETLLDQSLADAANPGGTVVTGVVKIAQRFLIILFTEQGSLVHLPTAGCRFMLDARRGRWRTSADVQQSFYFSLLDVKRQMRQMELATDPPDEKLFDVKILNIILSPRDRALLRLRLETQDGTARKFIAPIPIAPR